MAKKLLFVLLLVLVVLAFFQFDLGRHFDEDVLRSRQGDLQEHRLAHPVQTVLLFCALYIVMAALSLPGAALMTVAAGVIFGLVEGVVVVSFSSTIGATLAFLAARWLLADSLRARLGARLDAIDRGVQREGAFYLFSLRLIPIFPFWLINLAFGLTRISTGKFFWVSQLGMLPGTAAYVNAGTQLARLDSLNDLLSPGLILSFVALGVLPLVSKRIVEALRARRVYRGHRPPKNFDYNLLVIGAGSGGLVSAYIAAAIKARVGLIEKHKMGGDCLNTGCVPSKALLRSAKMLHQASRARDWGFRSTEVEYEFGEVMERVQDVIRKIEPHDSVERYESLGVDCIEGEAKVLDPWTVEVGDRRLSARCLVIATGARPLVPPIPGIEEVEPLTSDSVWNLRERPRRLVVVGGGPIGCELSQAFSRLGCAVTQVEALPRLLEREDEDVAQHVGSAFAAEGIEVLTSHRVSRFERDGADKVVVCAGPDGQERRIACDEVLLALGRQPNVRGFGLEELGVALSERGTVQVDEFLRTNYPNIYACGDVAGPYQFTHVAAHQAWYAAVNALFSPIKRFRVDYRVIPWSTFTDPEVARVGLSEQEAREQDIEVEVTRYGLDDLDRAIADGEDRGMVKVLTPPGSDRVLGACIVGAHAGDLLAEFVAAMRHGIGLGKILGTIHTYPTLAEANKYAAGVWKKAHKPEGVLRMLEKVHEVRRSRAKSRVAGWSIGLLLLTLVGVVGCSLFREDTAPLEPGERPEVLFTEPKDEVFDAVLKEYVDDEGFVDYDGLVDDKARLYEWYNSVAYLDRSAYEGWDDAGQIAFWCNVYNGLTLLLIVENYPIDPTIPNPLHPSESIQQIDDQWPGEHFTVMEEKISLNAIEHEILRVDYDEPRIHMAINCASIGCPPLRAEAFTAERLDEQLADQSRQFAADSEKFRIDEDDDTVHLSKILDWFGEDFTSKYKPADGFGDGDDKERSVLAFMAAHASEEDAAYLEAGGYDVEFLDYDWSLNKSRQ